MKDKHRPAASVGLDPQQLMQQGEFEIRSRNFAAAEKNLAEAARLAPASPRIQHLLGVALHEQDKLDRAIACYRKAVKLDGNRADAQRDLGAAYMDKRRYGDALGCYREALRLDPDDALACEGAAAALREMGDVIAARKHFQRALRLRIKGRLRRLWNGLLQPFRIYARSRLFEEAKRCLDANDMAGCEIRCRKILAARPADLPVMQLLGNTLLGTGRAREASEIFIEALRVDPESAELLHQLANTHLALAELEEARREIEGAFARAPSSVKIRVTFAAVCGAQGEYALSEQHSRAALRLEPDSLHALTNLGTALIEQGRIDEARMAYDEAVRLAPGDPFVCIARGAMSLEVDGRVDEGIEWFRKAQRLQPGLSRAEVKEASALLLSGRYAEGWERYEARKQHSSIGFELYESIHLRDWDGSALGGRSIVLYGEQGLGDEIMFSSCVPEVLAQTDTCHFLCHERLTGLFARSFSDATVIGWRRQGRDTKAIEVPRADFKCALGTLPRYLRGSREAFPDHNGYLLPDPSRVARWQNRLGELGPGVKMGISWQGGVPHTGKGRRSLGLRHLEPILRMPGISWISFQYTECRAELEQFFEDTGIRIHHWQEAIDDLEEHAALAAAVDHRVSVCTTFAHLCGALGKSVWILAPHVPEWRYGMEGTTMAWYPSARIYRQARPRQWNEAIERLGADLHEFVKHHSAAAIP